MARNAGGSEPARYISWVKDPAAVEPPEASGRWAAWRRALARRLDGFSWFDAVIIAVCVAVLDLIGVLIVSGWQTTACGDSCGLRTQLHLMHVALALTLGVVVPLPLLIALLARKGRVVVAVVQGLLCVGVLINAVSTEHRLVPRINGTAHCWNDLYSDADCPWGPKD
ncbi:MAG TPA: hypothetical protein VGX49_06940 [Jatrophihabitans sp.]|nr:hypothetical protein [Jatrophihabitans sp.]